MGPLTATQLARLKTDLEQIQGQLLEQLDSGKSATDIVTLDQTLVGRVSRVDAIQQQSKARSTHSQAKNRLDAVRRALNALRSGDYGYCDHCVEPIPFARLRARPETRYCIGCQDKIDRQR